VPIPVRTGGQFLASQFFTLLYVKIHSSRTLFADTRLPAFVRQSSTSLGVNSMDISATSAISSMMQIMQRGGNPGINAFGQSPLGSTGKLPEGLAGISPLGMMASQASELSADERAQAQAFRDEMRTSMRSGSFDPAAMAEKAPDFMKERAQEKGVSLTDAFQQIEDRVSNLRDNLRASGLGFMQGGNGSSQSQLLESLMSSLSGDEQES
jgi:hypothetical protein